MITYQTLQTVFADVSTAVNAEVGTTRVAYGSEIEAAQFKAPRSIDIYPLGYKYAGGVHRRGGVTILGVQTHRFTADIWATDESTTYSLEAAFSRALLRQTRSSARLIEGRWVPDANTQLGRVLRLSFEIDTPLLASASDTATVTSTETTAESY